MKRLILITLFLLNATAHAFGLTPGNGAPPTATPTTQGCVASASASCDTKPAGVTATPMVKLPDWCKNPNKTTVEQMICNTPPLAKADNDYNRLFQSADPSVQAEIAADRRATRDSCTDVNCVQTWYNNTNARLAMGSQQPAPLQSQFQPTLTQPMVTQYQMPPQPQMPQIQQGASWCTGQPENPSVGKLCKMAGVQQWDNQLNSAWQSRSRSKAEKQAQKQWRNQRDQMIAAGGSEQQIIQLYQQRIPQLQ